ncbi:MAG: hypothetical protein V5A84_00645 [Planctomycetota bacterium]
MKERIRNIYHWCVNRLPEGLLILCLLTALPAVIMAGHAIVQQFRTLAAGPSEYGSWLASNPWTVVSVILCVAAVTAMIWTLWRQRAQLWPVARKMIVEALHRKVVVILLVFFLVLIPALPFILQTQGSMKSQVQISFTYAMGLAETLLCFLAIFLGTASVCREIKQQEVHITDTKPLGRWKFLAGKLAGIVVMCSALLFAMMLGVYGLISYMSSKPDLSGLQDWQVERVEQEQEEVYNQIFTARKSVTPKNPDVSNRVEQTISGLKKKKELEKQYLSEDDARMKLTRRFLRMQYSVPPGRTKTWTLRGLKPPSQTDAEAVYLRFKLFSPGAQEQGSVKGSWTLLQPAKQVEGDSKKTTKKSGQQMVPVATLRRDWNTGSYQEFRVPTDAVTPEGKLHLVYRNLERANPVLFQIDPSLEALQKAGGFFGNFYRSVLVIMFHVILLAALGLMAGAMFSFPVASLLVVFVFLLGVSAPWFQALWEIVPAPFNIDGFPTLTHLLNHALNGLMEAVLNVVPNVSKYSPIGDLVHGTLVSWSFVARTGAIMVALKTGLVMLAATYAYYRRELARVIV